MYSRILINTILIIGLAVIQLSFISGLPLWFSGMNLTIVVLVFILGLNGFDLAFWWAAGLGYLFDVYSFMPFGVNIASMLIALSITYFLLKNFFTNRSLYTFLALTFFFTLSFRVLILFFNFLIDSFINENFTINMNWNFLSNELSGILLNFLSVIIIFNIITFVSSRFKPVFLKLR